MAETNHERILFHSITARDDDRDTSRTFLGAGRHGEIEFGQRWDCIMPAGYLATALVPAFCEEAIRSSYVFYLADKGKRRLAVLSLAAVFVIGEMIYDLSLFSAARAEFGLTLATSLLCIALITGALLHASLTYWTADRQRSGQGVWTVFCIALVFHSVFNLIAVGLLGAII